MTSRRRLFDMISRSLIRNGGARWGGLRSLRVCLAAAALGALVPEARADLHVLGGGGWTGPRGDSAAYVANGLTGEAALELEAGDNLGFALIASYATFDVDAAALKAARGLPASDPLDGGTSVTGLSLAPKLYLVNRDIAAYVTLGGGPRLVAQRATAAGTGLKSDRSEFAWGALAGFGLDIGFSDGFRIGFAPTYHRESAESGPLEWMSFVFYLKL